MVGNTPCFSMILMVYLSHESFNGSPPTFLRRNRRFQNQLPVVSPEIRCPSTPRRHRLIDLCTKKSVWIRFFQLHPSLCRAAMKRSLKKITGFGGGYRRIGHPWLFFMWSAVFVFSKSVFGSRRTCFNLLNKRQF